MGQGEEGTRKSRRAPIFPLVKAVREIEITCTFLDYVSTSVLYCPDFWGALTPILKTGTVGGEQAGATAQPGG